MTAQEAKQKYEQYMNDPRNSEPEFVRCCIQWHDDFGCANVTIALFPYDIDVKDDDDIFFYCNGLEDFLRLFSETGEDFTIREIYKFSQTL